MKSDSTEPFASGFFHLACIQDYSGYQYFISLYDRKFHCMATYTTSCLFTYQLMVIWVSSALCLFMDNAGMNIQVHVFV